VLAGLAAALLGVVVPIIYLVANLRNQGVIVFGGSKMSKSRGNVKAPDEMVQSHGADAVRLYMLFIAPWSEGGSWYEEGIDGPRRFLNGVHFLVTQTYPKKATEGDSREERELVRLTHQTIKSCTEDIDAFKFNTYISHLMILRNSLQDAHKSELAGTVAYRRALDAMILLLAPAAPHLAEELWQHRRRTAFSGDSERVFCHPQTGGVLDHKRYAKTLRLALAKAKIDKPMRPFHDGRHTAITNAAAAGTPPEALMTRSGHSDYATTRLYIDLAGESFREEAERLEGRVFGGMGTKNGYKVEAESPREETQTRD